MTNIPPPPPPGSPPPAWAPPPPPDAPAYGPVFAGFGARLGAVLLDGLIMGAMFIPGWIALLAGPKETKLCEVDSRGDIVLGGDNVNALCRGPSGGTWAIAIILFLLAFVAGIVYWAKLEGGRGQSIGKKALGIKTVDRQTGQPIGAGRAVGRFFARYLSGAVCYLGYLWMLWDKEQQTWHDKIVNSYVVKA